MTTKVLITGGAGFIGSHLADELLAGGYDVRALDSLIPQVHPESARPDYLADDVDLIVGDVRDPDAVRKALNGCDAVVHLAARVGVGQSMYEIAGYTSVNCVGTAVLLEAILDHPVAKLVVASSMSVYGEGLYRSASGELTTAGERTRQQLEAADWELPGPDGEPLRPEPTHETKAPSLASVYALSKFDQERMSLLFGSSYHIPTVALRFFNIYGSRQALSNPYTGVLAIFASRLLNGRPPQIFEDGNQRRDFVSVADISRAIRLSLEVGAADGEVVNVGSGRSVSVREVAEMLAAALGKPEIAPEVTGKYRVGDIRHCFSDISLARSLLGYEPQVELEDGLVDLAGWLEGQVAHDRFESMTEELASRGLTL